MTTERQTVGHVLLVEDDPSLSKVVADSLMDAGYSCDVVSRGFAGLAAATTGKFDLLILDLNLPELCGLDICREVKRINPRQPIIILTARATDVDLVAGFELGADDYLSKPFRPRELIARVRARLRDKREREIEAHLQQQAAAFGDSRFESISVGEMNFDFRRKRVSRNGIPLDLTAMEVDFLLVLASDPGSPFSRRELLQRVWGVSSESYKTNVSIFVCRLRKKIEEDVEQPQYILTVPGRGYRLAEPADFEEAKK